MINLKYPENEGTVCLATERQLKFLELDRKSIVGESIDWHKLERQNKNDDTKPQSVKFVWECERISKLIISENKDFDDCLTYRGDKSCEVYNLKCGCRYFWKVKCGKEESEIFTFTTENILPRWIYAEGITNVRDCGGWLTESGMRIRQGMIYRGSELNSHVKITRKGIKTFRDELKIKSVIDLRGKTELVRDIYKENYINIPVRAYDEYFEDFEENRKIFEFLSDEANYPVYLHCWGGADRTGTVAFLLNALLGAEIEDLIDDYEMTTLSLWGVRSRNTSLFLRMISALDRFDGDSVSEKAENFLLKSGVTKSQIENIKRIMLC